MVADADPLRVQFGEFSCIATVQQLVATPAIDLENVEDARAILEPYLQAWSATSEVLDRCPMIFRFTGAIYEQINVGDGDSVPTDVGGVLTTSCSGTVHVQHGQIPKPWPGMSTEGPLAAQLRQRWRDMEQGREPVPAASYYIASAVKQYYKPQEELNISRNVIDKLQRLASVADPVHGRKVNGHPGVLTHEDLVWMSTACHVIVQRVLEHEAGADTSRRITGDNLLSLR